MQLAPMQMPAPAMSVRTHMRRGAVAPSAAPAVDQAARKVSASASAEGEEIYIGFPKNDYAPRQGRKGRVIIDDPRKYPAKDNADFGPLGQLIGISGGWAGGEAALVKFKEACKEELAAEAAQKRPVQASEASVPAPKGNKVPIYVGFSKDELELKNSGAKGRVILDEPERYPNKEDIGPLAGATGGFAGGERGLLSYIESGELRLRKPGQPGGQPMSPLSIAFLVLVAGSGAAVLLSNVYDLGAGAFYPDALQRVASFDTFQLNLAVGALCLVGLLAGINASRQAVASLQTNISTATKDVVVSGTKIAVYGVFAAALFLAARAVLEV